MSRFPKDCWDKHCEHFHVTDMSIDDLLCACDVLSYECDACDEDYCHLRCPLAEKATACINPQYSNIGTAQYGQGVQKRIVTKADKIRAMTDEELADELLEWCACFMAVEWSRDMILDWLKEEADNGKN